MRSTAVSMAAVTLAAAVVVACNGGSAPANSTTPAATLEDGMVVATEGGMYGGRIWFIWEGQRQRIQQAAGMEPDWLPQMGLSIGKPAPLKLTVAPAGAGPTTWHVFPSSGPEAKLYLAYDGALHEVTLLTADDDAVMALPEALELLITRVHLPGD